MLTSEKLLQITIDDIKNFDDIREDLVERLMDLDVHYQGTSATIGLTIEEDLTGYLTTYIASNCYPGEIKVYRHSGLGESMYDYGCEDEEEYEAFVEDHRDCYEDRAWDILENLSLLPWD